MNMLTMVSNALKSIFLKHADQINSQAKALQRRRKFTPSSLAQTVIPAFLKNPDATLEDIACMAVASGVDVSLQAIEQR
jgi:hypothetical protein